MAITHISGSQESLSINKKIRIGLVCLLIYIFTSATLPYLFQPQISGAPWGQPELADPYVRGTANDRLTFTYYFYWYNFTAGVPIVKDCIDSIMVHPVNITGVYTYDVYWHYREFKDMIQAGFDVFLPDYWGNSSWSLGGLNVMQQALDMLKAENANADNIRNVTNPIPKVAMFFDTTSMMIKFHTINDEGKSITTADLRNATCLEWFYGYIRDFYTCFNEDDIQQFESADNETAPTAYIVWLYGMDYFIYSGQSALDYCKARFLEEFNHTLIFIGGPDWIIQCPQLDGIYKWGTAIDGMVYYPTSPIKIASFGAGINNGNATHGAVCHASEPILHRPRTPELYVDNWTTAMGKNPNWIVVETWNELYEGTGICETDEYNVTYINISGDYSKLFHALALPWNGLRIENVGGIVFSAVLNGFILIILLRLRKRLPITRNETNSV